MCAHQNALGPNYCRRGYNFQYESTCRSSELSHFAYECLQRRSDEEEGAPALNKTDHFYLIPPKKK